MKTLLLIMNPRAIPECIDALRELRIDKAWMSYYTEAELERVVPHIVASTNYDRFVFISDDATPTQAALDRVLSIHDEHPDAVACGWVNLDSISDRSTYNPQPLDLDQIGTMDAYNLASIQEARTMSGIQRTYFHGMCLATMNRQLLERYPFATYSGHASDLHQCARLQADDVPIYTAADTGFHHVKEISQTLDRAHEKRLLIGERASRTTLEVLV